MKTRIGMWGGSCAIRLPKMAVETLGMKAGMLVELEMESDRLTIRPDHAAYTLDALVAQAKGLVPPRSLDDGSAGSEAL